MSLTITPSWLCNLRCRFCFQQQFGHQPHLSPNALYERLAPVYAHTNSVVLLGGGPSVIPGCKQYLRALAARYPNMTFTLVTNGVCLDDDWLDLLISSRTRLVVSLNASNGVTYGALLRHGSGPAIWQRVLVNCVKYLKRRELLGVSEPRLMLSMVITPESAADIEAFVLLTAHLGADCKLLYDCRGPQYQQHPAVQQSYDTVMALKLLLSERVFLKIVNLSPETARAKETFWEQELTAGRLAPRKRQLLTRLAQVRLPEGISLDPTLPPPVSTHPLELRSLPAHSWDEEAPARRRQIQIAGRTVCAAPWHGLVILPAGDVLPCSRLTNFVLGNLEEQDLISIWHGEAAQHLRRLMMEGDYRYCDPSCPANRNPASYKEGARFVPEHEARFEAGDYNGALPGYERAVAQRPTDPVLLYRLAFCHHLAGDALRALSLYAAALTAGFPEFWVRYNRAALLERLGRPRQALADAARAIELDPTHEGARLVFERLAEGAAPTASTACSAVEDPGLAAGS